MPTHNKRTLPGTAIPLFDEHSAAQCLVAGGLLLFPTETYYALGSLASATQAVDTVYQVKARETSHPLPMVVANTAQAAMVCMLETAPPRLLDFWPGPLTLLLPCRENSGMAPQLVNKDGLVAVRVSSHPLVARLCLATAFPLTASSANISGHPPAKSAGTLAPALLARLAQTPLPSGILACATDIGQTSGSAPSTIVRPLQDGSLAIHRQGAISIQTLQSAGFACTL